VVVREAELQVGGRALAPGRISIQSHTSPVVSWNVEEHLSTDGARVRFPIVAMDTDSHLQIAPEEGDRFLPALVPLDGADPVVFDLGPHLLQVRVESTDGGDLALGRLAAQQENAPRTSWISENGELHLLRVRAGGVYLQASAAGYQSVERYLEITGDRAVTLSLQPQD
jgi:hypothetical protein